MHLRSTVADVEPDVATGRFREGGCRPADELDHVCRRALERELPRADARHVEQPVDQTPQAISGLSGVRDIPTYDLAVRHGRSQVTFGELESGVHGGERCAELVRRDRDELLAHL